MKAFGRFCIFFLGFSHLISCNESNEKNFIGAYYDQNHPIPIHQFASVKDSQLYLIDELNHEATSVPVIDDSILWKLDNDGLLILDFRDKNLRCIKQLKKVTSLMTYT